MEKNNDEIIYFIFPEDWYQEESEIGNVIFAGCVDNENN